MRRNTHLLLLAIGSLLFLWNHPALADQSIEFAVDAQVTAELSPDRPLRTTTFFVNRVAYDIVHGNPPEIARFDFEDQTVDLVSRSKRWRTQVRFADLLRYQANQRARAQKRDGLGAFLANPTFTKEIDANQQTLKLSSPWLSYQVQFEPASTDVVDSLTALADWSARLGCLLSPLAPPAAARIELNKALRKQSWRAKTVTRRGEARARSLGVVTSRHDIRKPLRDSDWEIIRGIEKDLKSFSLVSFFEFRAEQLSAVPAVKK